MNDTNSIRSNLDKLQMSDTFSLILFALYKIRDVDEYSTLSELAYILDKNSLLSLCEYFGGLTIKIPTIQELEDLVNSLLLYEYIDIEHMSFEEAVKKIGLESYETRSARKNYNELSKVLEKYSLV